MGCCASTRRWAPTTRQYKLPWRASDEERASSFPLDALTFVVTHFLPHLNQDAVYRILRAEGLNRVPPSGQTCKLQGTFKDYQVGFVHVDVKHLYKLRDRDSSICNRYLLVAINRASRYIHLALKDDETTTSPSHSLRTPSMPSPAESPHVLTDPAPASPPMPSRQPARGTACNTVRRPCTPKTNGMVGRFNGRVQRDVLGITIYTTPT